MCKNCHRRRPLDLELAIPIAEQVNTEIVDVYIGKIREVVEGPLERGTYDKVKYLLQDFMDDLEKAGVLGREECQECFR